MMYFTARPTPRRLTAYLQATPLREIITPPLVLGFPANEGNRKGVSLN